jgi:hypothetical protein
MPSGAWLTLWDPTMGRDTYYGPMPRRLWLVAQYYRFRRWVYRSTGYRWYRLKHAPCPYEEHCKLCYRCGRCQNHGRPCVDDPIAVPSFLPHEDLIDAEIGEWALERRIEKGE